MAAKPTVAIVGASGFVGKFITTGFQRNAGWNVSLLTRKGGASKLAEFAAKGATVKEVDFNVEAEVVEALKGVDTVVSTVGTEGLLGQIEVAKAAKAAGVKRFVPSEFGLDTGAPGIREYFPLLGYKFATRDAIEAAGLEHTYVITGFFTESTFTPAFGWDLDTGKVTLKGKTDTPFTVTSLEDIGRWLPDLLKDPASKNATVYLEGEKTTWDEAVDTISKATGKKLEVTRKTVAELDADIAAAPVPFAAFLDLLVKAIGDGWASVPTDKKWNKDGPNVTIAKLVTA